MALTRWNPLALLVAFSLFASPAAAVNINWVTVGDAGNTADTSGFGTVTTTYRISETEVTNTQYAEFLNAVDPTGANALGFYNSNMTEDATNGGIGFDVTNPVGTRYLPKLGFTDKPVNYVSFYDALRFTNWLHNGQGSGDTETGAYTLLGGTETPSNGTSVTRNAEATIFLTSEDEWYKAAYYAAASTTYFEYPTGSDTQTSCDANPLLSNAANCGGAVGGVSDVGAYTASASPAGTFDQGGNVWEWNEAIIGGSLRGQRGGAFSRDPMFLAASERNAGLPTFEDDSMGFRVASVVPEPGTGLLLLTGLLAAARWGRQGANRATRG